MSDVMLSGRTILVTGAARGLGLVLAETLRGCGARLVLADRDAEAGVAAAEKLGARFVPVDLAEPDAILAMAADVAAQEGALDGLVNNAAIATGLGGVTFEVIEQ